MAQNSSPCAPLIQWPQSMCVDLTMIDNLVGGSLRGVPKLNAPIISVNRELLCQFYLSYSSLPVCRPFKLPRREANHQEVSFLCSKKDYKCYINADWSLFPRTLENNNFVTVMATTEPVETPVQSEVCYPSSRNRS